MSKLEYVERLTRWLIPDNDPEDAELARRARESLGLDGVYTGSSRRIARIVKLAYLRGVRRGAAIAWASEQPIATRASEVDP